MSKRTLKTASEQKPEAMQVALKRAYPQASSDDVIQNTHRQMGAKVSAIGTN